MSENLRKAEFSIIVAGKPATVLYRHQLDTGTQTICVNGDTVLQRANFIGGKEKFRIFGVKSEFNIQVLADGQFFYTLMVDGKELGIWRDPLYKWRVKTAGIECEVSLDLTTNELKIDGAKIETKPKFCYLTGETITEFRLFKGVPCQLETYKDANKEGIAFQLLVRGEKVTPLR